MDEIILRNENGQILASSREVADRFGKNHKDVLESIRNLTAENSAVKDMFQISQYTNSRGRNYDQYLMNRDGFSLLAMGFTGKKALEWKLKYINAFNIMEEKLKSGNYLSDEEKWKLQLFSDDPLEVRIAHEKLCELEVAKATAPLIPKAEYHDNVLNKDGLITTTVIAKDLGLRSAMRLNQIMNRNAIIYKNSSGTWCPYADYEWLINEKYADYQSYENDNSAPCLKWTEKGRKWIIENFDNWAN